MVGGAAYTSALGWVGRLTHQLYGGWGGLHISFRVDGVACASALGWVGWLAHQL